MPDNSPLSSPLVGDTANALSPTYSERAKTMPTDSGTIQLPHGQTITPQDIDQAIGLAMGFSGGGLSTKGMAAIEPILALKDAVPSAEVAPGMIRLWRGGGNNPGGPKWVTTDRKYAERYTTPGLARGGKAGSYLQYVDVPAGDPRVQMPAGQSVHSFEATPDIADRLQPFWQQK